MTQEEREQVVRLLRHAAENDGIAGSYHDLFGVDIIAECERRFMHPIWELAVQAREAVHAEGRFEPFYEGTYYEQCTIAAQRVEDGSWP